MQATTNGIIIDRGRGPEIAGTRITVYDVMEYLTEGWQTEEIAGLFRVSPPDIKAALDYIDEHRDEVEAEYRRIVKRHRDYRYPPEVQAKVDQSRGAARRRLEEIRRQRESADAEIDG